MLDMGLSTVAKYANRRGTRKGVDKDEFLGGESIK